MNKKHKHAEVIKAWADGAEIQASYKGGPWINFDEPSWCPETDFRIKPPAPKWPETTISGESLERIYLDTDSGDSGYDDFIALANAAIAHALETGQVILPPNKD